MDEEKEHEDAMRLNCFQEAAARAKKTATIAEIIKEAKKIERFVLKQRPAKIIKLVDKEKKK